MKAIEVKDQVRLSTSKTLELVLSGVRYRLFRAAITVVIIALAAAFLTTMLTESLSARTVAEAIRQQVWPREKFLLLVGRISQPMTEQEVIGDLAIIAEPMAQRKVEQDNRRKELEIRGALSDEDFQKLIDLAIRERAYNAFFEGLGEGQRRALVGRAVGSEIYSALLDPERFSLFAKRLAELGVLAQFPQAKAEVFQTYLHQRKETEGLRRKILDGNAAAIAQLQKDLLKGRSAREVLASADAGTLAELRKAGFQLDEQDLRQVREQAALTIDAEKILRLLNSKRLLQLLADRRGKKVSQVDSDDLLREADSASGSRWLAEQSLAAAADELDQKARAIAGVAAQRIYEDVSRKVPPDLLSEDKKAGKKKNKSDKAADLQKPLRAALGGVNLSYMLRDEDAVETLREGLLRKLSPSAEELAELTRSAAQAAKEAGVVTAAQLGDLRQAVALVNLSLALASDDKAAAQIKLALSYLLDEPLPPPPALDEAILKQAAAETGLPTTLSAERIKTVASERLFDDKLRDVQATVREAAGGGGVLGFSNRTMWLLVVSLIVCVVGIANAMLMSVTERFREIATMKCLGATDGFIMLNFILESCMQGVAGGVVGALLGMLLGTLRSWWKYGWTAMQHFPTSEVLISGGLAIVMGVIISAMAAVYPAWVAARLAPMEAMRIE